MLAIESLQSSPIKLARAAVLIGSVLVFGASIDASAQQLFRYRGADGFWVYSDKPPDDAGSYERLALDSSPQSAEVNVLRRDVPGGIALIAQNGFHSVVQIAYQITAPVNVTGPARGNRVLPPHSETELGLLLLERPNESSTFELSYQYIPGQPGAEHQDDYAYRVPYAVAATYRVSQAYPSTITHSDVSSRNAIDFVLPVGTGVYAARNGIVIQIATDNFESGMDLDSDLNRANIVRVLHDDGTMSLYGHLNWNSIRVAPGQTVARGEYIADSGNTGFSSGPHLHFVVQRNAGGVIESVPVLFQGGDGRAFAIRSGDLVTAY